MNWFNLLKYIAWFSTWIIQYQCYKHWAWKITSLIFASNQNNIFTILKWVWNQNKALKYITSHHVQCSCYLVILPLKLLLWWLNIFNLTWHLMAWWWQEMTFLVWTPAPHSWEHVDQADQRVLSVEVWDPEVIGPLPDKDISRIETCIKYNFTLIQVGEWGWEDYAILLTKPLKCLVEIIIFHIW